APPVLAFEIAFDRALAAVGRVEIGSAKMVAVLALDEGRPPGARIVAGLGTLDLDDVGAEIGEHLPGPRSGQNARQLQHANAGQWALIRTRRRAGRRTRHGQLPSNKTRRDGPRNARCVA